MTPSSSPAPVTEAEVAAAAAELVAAFAGTRTREYFAAFDAEATFVFHTEDRRLESRADYEALWNTWLAEGWAVTACESTDVRIQLFGATAVFSHTVLTTAGTPEEQATTRERETIVFTRSGGRIVAVHEHLSPLPDGTSSPEDLPVSVPSSAAADA